MTYHPQLFKNKNVEIGRDYRERWEIIKEFVPEDGILFDIGSSAGAFITKSFLKSERLHLISLEASTEEAETQKRVIQSHDCNRVCLVSGMITSYFTNEWASSGDRIDLSLLLSVIHWFDNPGAVLRDLSSISKKVIVEVPDKNDVGACGQDFIKEMEDPVQWCNKVTGLPSRLLGRASRHTSDVLSHVILIENDNAAVDGEAQVELSNLMSLGRLLWPEKEFWMQSARSSSIRNSTSLMPLRRNMYWTGNGLDVRKSDVAEFKWNVGGSEKLRDEDLSEKRQIDLRYELKFFDRLMSAWFGNETALTFAAVDRLLPLQRVRTNVFKRLTKTARLLLPGDSYQSLRDFVKNTGQRE